MGSPLCKTKIANNKEHYIKMWLSSEEVLVILFTTTTRFSKVIKHPTNIINASSSKIKTVIVFLYVTQHKSTAITNLTRSLGKLVNVDVYFFTQLSVLNGYCKTTTEHIKKITATEGRFINRLIINPTLLMSQTYQKIHPHSWPALLWKDLYQDGLLLKYRIPQLHGGFVTQTGYIVPWKIDTISTSDVVDATPVTVEYDSIDEPGEIFM